jgi:hypothetical protein
MESGAGGTTSCKSSAAPCLPPIITMPCKLCGENAKTIDNPENPAYYHCPDCDLIFISEKCFVNCEYELHRYKQHNNSIENRGYVDFLAGFLKAAEIDKMGKVENALDFGCGPEPVLQVLLNDMGIHTDIYDPYFFPVKIYIDKQYNLITSTEVFEHLKNPLETLTLLESLLAENGVLAVKTLFHTTCDDFKSWWYRRDSTHICFYSPRTFAWIEDRFNLKIKKMDNSSICVFQKRI